MPARTFLLFFALLGAAHVDDLQLDVPRLAHDKLFAQFYAVHHNYPA